MKEQIYKKVGRRYKPLGFNDGWTGFPADGIWIVQKQADGVHSSECVLKISELQDMQPAVNLILRYKQVLLDFLLKEREEGRIFINNETLNGFVLRMLKEISKNPPSL